MKFYIYTSTFFSIAIIIYNILPFFIIYLFYHFLISFHKLILDTC